MGLFDDLFDRAKGFFDKEGDEGQQVQKRCYYELLEVRRDADDDDIKRAYKKLALKWHPDKNPERKDECTAYFVLLQQAYEVLADPQERAFYDKHRENIIRGSAPEEKNDTGINLFPFFQKCYRGFGEDADSFYGVYRQLFDRLASEEYPYFEEDEERDIPSFGAPRSDYEQVVGPFYDTWTSFATRRSFAWLDRYDLRQAENHYVLKQMDKENKKLRDEGKRKRNEQIRELAAYVRRRDPRVQLHRAQLEERKAAELMRVETQRQKRIRENLAQLNEQQLPSLLDENHLDDLGRIENELDEQFGVLACDEEDDAGSDRFFCIVCEKRFKTAKTFANHQKSKKHKDAVADLRKYMVDDDQRLFEDAQGGGGADDDDDEDAEAAAVEETKLSKKARRKQRKNAKENANEAGAIVDESAADEAVAPQSEPPAETSPESTPPDNAEAPSVAAVHEPKKAAKGGKPKNRKGASATSDSAKKAPPASAPAGPVHAECQICGDEFSSKTKLFAHITATGHAALKDASSGGKKAKRKN